MITGIEVIATVTALSSAYSGACSLYLQWREKRRADRLAKGEPDNRESNHEVALLKTLSSSGAEIERKYERGYRNFGGLFARGDTITQNKLLKQLVQLQTIVIALLTEALNSSGISLPQMVRILSTSSAAHTGALRALSGQYERMMKVRNQPRIIKAGDRVQEIMETEHNPLPTRIPVVSFNLAARSMAHMKHDMHVLQVCFEKIKKSLIAHTTNYTITTGRSMSSGLKSVEKHYKSAIKQVPKYRPLSMSAVTTIRSLRPLHARSGRSLKILKSSITAETASARTGLAKMLVKHGIKRTAGERPLNALRIDLAKRLVMPRIKAIPNLKLQLKWNAFVRHSLKVRGQWARWTRKRPCLPKHNTSKKARPASRSNAKCNSKSNTQAQIQRLKKGASQFTERVHQVAIRKAP